MSPLSPKGLLFHALTEIHHNVLSGAFFSVSTLSVSPASISLLMLAGFRGLSLVQGTQFSNSRPHISGFVGFSETLPRPSLSHVAAHPGLSGIFHPFHKLTLLSTVQKRTFTSCINLLIAPRRTH